MTTATASIPQVNFVSDNSGKPVFVQIPIQEWAAFVAEYQRLAANSLRATAAAENWKNLSQDLPDIPEISMAEIVAEVKTVRKLRSQPKN